MCRSPCAAATSRAVPGRARSQSLPRRRTIPTPHPPPGPSEPRAATSLLVSAFGVVPAPAPAPAPATRRLDAQHIAGLERHAHFRSERHAVQERAPTRPVAPARGSARGVAPSLGQNARLHRRQRLELPYHPVAPPPLARSEERRVGK